MHTFAIFSCFYSRLQRLIVVKQWNSHKGAIIFTKRSLHSQVCWFFLQLRAQRQHSPRDTIQHLNGRATARKHTVIDKLSQISRGEIGYSSVEIVDYPVRNGKNLRNFDFILPKFHFILPKFYFAPRWGILFSSVEFCRFSRSYWLETLLHLVPLEEPSAHL